MAFCHSLAPETALLFCAYCFMQCFSAIPCKDCEYVSFANFKAHTHQLKPIALLGFLLQQRVSGAGLAKPQIFLQVGQQLLLQLQWYQANQQFQPTARRIYRWNYFCLCLSSDLETGSRQNPAAHECTPSRLEAACQVPVSVLRISARCIAEFDRPHGQSQLQRDESALFCGASNCQQLRVVPWETRHAGSSSFENDSCGKIQQ